MTFNYQADTETTIPRNDRCGGLEAQTNAEALSELGEN